MKDSDGKYYTVCCVFLLVTKAVYGTAQAPMDVQAMNYSRLMLRKRDFNPDTYFSF